MNLISGIDITASALNAQKTRLDIVAQNIANAQTTRTPSGGPYQRQVVSFEGELVRHGVDANPTDAANQPSDDHAHPAAAPGRAKILRNQEAKRVHGR